MAIKECLLKSFSLEWPIVFFKIGGINNGGGLVNTEIINSNGGVTAGISLPYAVYGHCVVTLNDGRVMILGGNDGSSSLRKVLIFNSTSGTFSDAPDMLYTRDSHACAIFNSPLHYHREVVLAAGGAYRDQVELLDYQTEGSTWQESKKFWAWQMDNKINSNDFCVLRKQAWKLSSSKCEPNFYLVYFKHTF